MDDRHLIDRLQTRLAEQDTTNFNVLDFVYASGSPLEALMYTRLFWPAFVEIDDMVFLQDTMEDDEDRARVQETLERYGGDRGKTEQSFNLVEVPSALFGARLGETTEDEDHWLAECLVEMWAARLHQLFPLRRFTVEVVEPEETGGEVGVVFYQQTRGAEDTGL